MVQSTGMLAPLTITHTHTHTPKTKLFRCEAKVNGKYYHKPFVGDYKHWTRDPRTGDPRTQGPEDTRTRGPEDLRTRGPRTRGPGTQRSSSVALSFYDRNATCVNVLSSNVWLYRCWSQSLHCYTHSCARLCYFTLSASFLYLFFTLQTQE